MQPVTILGLVLCLGVLALRAYAARQNPAPRDPRRIGKTARVLFAALLTLLAVYYNLNRTEHSLDGKGAYEPSAMEKVVRYLSR